MKKLILITALFITATFLTATAQYTKLLDFAGTSNGKNPLNSLISDGTFLYGMTYDGGLNNLGTIFKIMPDGTGYIKLLDFAGASNGSYPVGPLMTEGGMLYGMTAYGGTNDIGTLFKIMPDGTGYTKLLDFAGAANGSYPYGSLISDGSFLYGMTNAGGTNDLGTLFKIMHNGTGYTKLLDFTGAANGSYPQGYLFFNGGFLYGMTYGGGTNDLGTIFKIMPDGTLYSKLLDFAGTTNGSSPLGDLITDGTFLYGMTSAGGTSNLGTIFKIMPDGTGYSKLLDFAGAANGSNPYGSLTFDGGILYGMTTFGGTSNMGVLFKILQNGNGYSKLLDFSGVDGNNPIGTLISDGTFFYGMTYSGGINTQGTVFKYQIPQPPQINILICAGESSIANVIDIDNKLTATGLFNNVDVFQANTSTPTLALLQTYNAVLVFSNLSYFNSTSLGNVMAQYVDGGGGVVLTAMDFNTTTTRRLLGSFDNATYRVINSGSATFGTASLGTVSLPSHPVMAGVSTFINGTGNNRINSSTLYPGSGAYTIASYNTGQILVAARDNAGTAGNKRRVDVNFFPASSTASNNFWIAATDGAKILANALLYVACSGPVITASGSAQFCGTVGTVTLTASAGSTYLWSPGGETTQSITVSSVGTYSVTVDGIPACNAATIIVKPIPSITPSGPTSFCTPGSVTLTASTAGPWLWSSGQTTQSITLTGSGTRTVSVNGCISAPTIVTATNPPSVPVTGSNSPVLCGNTTLNLTSSTIAGVTYSWTGPNGFSSSQQNPSITNVTPSESGTYTVTVTNSGGCTRSALTNVIVSTGTLNGTYTVGVAGNYPTLTAAISAYNSNCLTGPVIFELIDGGYPSETYPLTISNNSSASSVNTLTIRPATGVTGIELTSSNAVATFDLNRARYIIIDGRPGGTGSKDMKIANTHNTGGSSVIRFINDAMNNVVQYAILEKAGQGINASDQVILFSTTAYGTGNDNNTIDNCDLKDGATTYNTGVRCNATTNDNNTISNNNIYNFFNSSFSSFGISLPNFNAGTNWNITGNSFYQTTTRSGSFTAISVTSGNTVSGNFIGGTAPGCGGTNWTISGSSADMVGILVTGGSTAYIIDGNTISNFSVTNTSTSSISRPFIGIQNSGVTGNGTIINNVIGSSSVYGAILVSTGTLTAEVYGISQNVGNAIISDNTIGGIVLTYNSNLSSNYKDIFFSGINLRQSGGSSISNSSFTTVSGNYIGSETVSNSMYVNDISPQHAFTLTIYLCGISDFVLAGTNGVDSNSIANFAAQTIGGNNTQNITRGIWAQVNNIRHNRIHHFSGIGILAESTSGPFNLSENEVFAGGQTGIWSMAGSNSGVISKNKIHHISGTGLNVQAGGNILVSNNMISLGFDADGNVLPDYVTLYGIVGGFSGQYINNSVYIGGSAIYDNSSAYTYACLVNASSNPIFKNNIFVNQRTTIGGTGKHYAIRVADSNPLISDYNLFDTSDPATLAHIYPSDHTFASFKAATGQDANSIEGDAMFVNPNGSVANVDLHINTSFSSPASGAGTFIATVTDDIDGEIRNNPPDIGADEFISCSAPSIACIGNITVSNDSGSCSAIVNYAAATVTGTPAPSVTYSQNSGTSFNAGTTTVTVIATNACGSDSCTFDITVNDTVNPVISCPVNIVTSTDPGVCGAQVFYNLTYSDNCNGPLTVISNQTLTSGSVFPVGTTTNTLIVTDASGNADTCSFTVTVNDTENPTISCPANITATVNTSGCSSLVTYSMPAYSDNCSGATLTQTAGLASGAAFPAGVTTNTFMVTDASGNTATCSFTVTVNSTLAVNAGNDESTFYGYSGDQTVSHTASASGGTGPYAYSWTMNRPLNCNQVNLAGDEIFNGGTCMNNICPSSGSPTLNPVCTGSASVTVKLIDTTYVRVIVTDALGCTATDSFLVMAVDVRCFSGNNQNQKVQICHHTNNPNNQWVQMCVEENVVPILVAQGDYVGTCNAVREASISDMTNDWYINLFPNPAHQSVSVSFSFDKESNYEIQLMDVTGRLVQSYNGVSHIGENEKLLDLSNIAKGIYQVLFIIDDKQELKKLVVK